MRDKKDITYCELDESFPEEQEVEKEAFLDKVFNYQVNYGYASKKTIDFLYKSLEVNPRNLYAYHYLFHIYIVKLELDKAKEMAWKLIDFIDCSLFRYNLTLLENTNHIYTQAYIWGDHSKLPPSVINALEESEFIRNLKPTIDKLKKGD